MASIWSIAPARSSPRSWIRSRKWPRSSPKLPMPAMSSRSVSSRSTWRSIRWTRSRSRTRRWWRRMPPPLRRWSTRPRPWTNGFPSSASRRTPRLPTKGVAPLRSGQRSRGKDCCREARADREVVERIKRARNCPRFRSFPRKRGPRAATPSFLKTGFPLARGRAKSGVTPSAPRVRQSARRANHRAWPALGPKAVRRSAGRRYFSRAPDRSARALRPACRSACPRWSWP